MTAAPLLRSVLLLRGDPLKDLNPNKLPTRSWRGQGAQFLEAKLKRDWQEKARLAWLEAGQPEYNQPVRIAFEVRRARSIDPDNALAGLKSVIDGLKAKKGRLGLVPDDSPAFVSYAPVEFVTGKLWAKEPHVLITVTPRITDGKPL